MSKASAELKPYAVTAENSRGREHPEALPERIDPFAFDRQRVLHSAAFRRLEYKTQVFVTGVHDHYRTRLTHTLEVASVARRLCTALQVNVSVGELIALTHDLGHPPFGHAGEVALRDLMRDYGGFEHNGQSLRVIEYLEHPYPPFRGLNLSYEVRESLAKHCTIYDKPGVHPLADGTLAPIEGQIANLADRVAYDCHDLEDAFEPGLLNEKDLADIDLWREAASGARKTWPDLPLGAIRRPILDRLEQMLLDDIVAESRRRIAAAKVQTVDEVRNCGQTLIDFAPRMESRLKELEAFLFSRVYRHPTLIRMDAKAARFIQQLFEAYLGEPRMLPPRFVARIAEQGAYRVVCDYIAGMTDRFCQDEYKRLFEPFERV
jgi:dGTPase